MEGKRGSECLLKPVSNIDFNPNYYDEEKDTHQTNEYYSSDDFGF